MIIQLQDFLAQMAIGAPPSEIQKWTNDLNTAGIYSVDGLRNVVGSSVWNKLLPPGPRGAIENFSSGIDLCPHSRYINIFKAQPRFHVPNPKLHRILFDYNGPSSYNISVALDVVGQLLWDPSVLNNYVFQDRNDLEDNASPTPEEGEEAKKHFGDGPKITVRDDLGLSFAYTQRTDETVITLNSELVKEDELQAINYRKIVLLTVTLLHELSHWKLRRETKRESPKKFKWKRNSEAESGK
eukprot:TRINITY_DN14949_c0_g1_i3.p1 TRINITY_DN14949_c0_g1~~TRINITY_DN14949_c0_g1_i3.p1  ORF type:complete len:241 (-),score=37.30 TRINITY_DN14949_c0_g1_i3:683-1405(-)